MSELRVRAVVSARRLDVDFSVAAGEVLAMVGPNGAGKSTALHVVAGLVRPDEGFVRLGDRVLTDTAAGLHTATHDRRVGLLLQNPLLFPHLSVVSNVAFGPRSRRRTPAAFRTSRAQARGTALRWLREVNAEQFADRTPRQLSGGQAQRVAIARALAAEPEVLLLDEPLAALDVAAAAGIRAVLRAAVTRTGCAVILVTHDLSDVFTLADRVMVIEAGQVAETGPVTEVLAAPRSQFGARIAGVNLVSGTIEPDGALRTAAGARWHAEPGGGLAPETRAVAVFPPTAVAVYREQPHGSPRNTVQVLVAELDFRGSAVIVRGDSQPDGAPGLAAEITVEAAAELRLAPGDRVWFAVKAHEAVLHPVPHGPAPAAITPR